jgi:hypothetical protein
METMSIIVVVCTVVYTAISIGLLVESVKTRKQKVSPYMISFLRSTEDHRMLALVVKNIGEGAAKKLKINVLNDYAILKKMKYQLSNIGIFKKGFNLFPPQHELVFLIDAWANLNEDIQDDRQIVIEFSYERVDGEKYREVFNLPFNQAKGGIYINPPETYLGKIADYLHDISKQIGNK